MTFPMVELLVYPFLGRADHTVDYVEMPGKLPPLVIESVREFASPDMASILKRSPLAANDLPRRDGSAAAKAAQKEFDAIGGICRDTAFPGFCFQGVPRMTVERVLEYAYAAGAGGFLAGPNDLAGRGANALSGSRGGLGCVEKGKRCDPEEPQRANEGARTLVATSLPEIRIRSPGG